MSRIRKAVRSAAKLKIHLSGVQGSGKTYGALLIAKGLCGDWNKIVVIDTENKSADLYADLGNYSVLTLTDHSPEGYIKAIQECEVEGFEVIIVDSITHEWNYILNAHSQLEGNSFTNWRYFTPRHENFKNKIINSPCHIITTVRRDIEYVLSEGGKKVEKHGTKENTRSGWGYEVTIAFEIQENNIALISKDRTQLFPKERNIGKLTESVGEELKVWSSGSGADKELLLTAALVDINNAKTTNDLLQIKVQYSSLKEVEDFKTSFVDKVNYFKQLNTQQ